MVPRRAGSGIPLHVLAERCGAELSGDGSIVIDAVATIDDAGPGAIVFLANPRYRARLAGTRASAAIVSPADAAATPLPKLISANPYATYAQVATELHPAAPAEAGIHASVSIAASAKVAASAMVAAHATIGERTQIGARAQIHAGCVVGDDCSIGDDVVLHPNVVVYARTRIGARGVIHAGAVLGADGFGMAEHEGQWIKVPQVGGLAIGDDVEIGANTTIDRGAIGDTRIGNDVKLDNQIQIGHNCVIGPHSAIAGCVGIAGSTRIGRNCKIGGAAMIAGHLEIADNTVISAATAVFESIPTAGVYTGMFPALPHREWRHVASILRQLRSILQRLRELEGGRGSKGE
jgi:UDP-3-O-[3-hydroxymyristoyl] glucosamine N-acyltransferase